MRGSELELEIEGKSVRPAWARWELWLRYLLAARVSILAGVLLVVVLPFVLGGSGMIANLLVVESGWQLFWSVGFVLAASMVCGLTLLLTFQHAPLRLGLPPLLRRDVLEGRVLAVGSGLYVAALPLIVLLWRRSDLEGYPHPLAVRMGAVGGGFLLFSLVLGLTERLRVPLQGWFAARRLPFELPRSLSAGYVEDGRVLVDHLAALTFWGILFVLYWAGYLLLDPAHLSPSFPPLALLMMLHMVCTASLAGLAFFIDRFHVPLLVPLVVWVALVYRVKDTDHFFSVWAQDREGRPAAAAPAPAEAPVERWLEHRLVEGGEAGGPREPVLVVVCASGGGIQAAAWTAEVLCGLERELGPEFVPSIRFVSAVSGGSVGAMHFLAQLDQAGRAGPRLELARQLSRRSSLSASIWGIVYPDFLRAVFPLGMLEPGFDRASALEGAWKSPWEDDPASTAPLGARLGEWAARTAQGSLPGIVFNATVVETGRRMLFSTVEIPGALEARSFLGDHGGRDVDVVSAVRMSATFPYVTPVARPRVADGEGDAPGDGPDDRTGDAFREHLADGGYFDNFGVYSAVEWLIALLSDPELRLEERVAKVLVLEIRAFPEAGAHLAACRREQAGGLTYELAGPLRAMLAVRTSTQTARNDTELALLRSRWPGLIEPSIVVRPPTAAPFQEDGALGDEPPARCWCEAEEIPLSWHLSRAQKGAVSEAWAAVRERAVERLAPHFGRAGQPQDGG